MRFSLIALVFAYCALSAVPSVDVAAMDRGSPSKELGTERGAGNNQGQGSTSGHETPVPGSDSQEHATVSPSPEKTCIARTLCSLENTGCYDPDERECRAHCHRHCE
jgi:hypothetical protein